MSKQCHPKVSFDYVPLIGTQNYHFICFIKISSTESQTILFWDIFFIHDLSISLLIPVKISSNFMNFGKLTTDIIFLVSDTNFQTKWFIWTICLYFNLNKSKLEKDMFVFTNKNNYNVPIFCLSVISLYWILESFSIFFFIDFCQNFWKQGEYWFKNI